jgi:hypothetical protein
VAKQFAIHEFGKALMATLLRQSRATQGLRPRLERVERVSMVPRGRCAPELPTPLPHATPSVPARLVIR